MSIYIKGMEMPKNHRHMIFMSNGDITDLDGKTIAKAIELPPHGRLGDLDALVKKSYEIKSCVGRYSRVVHIEDVKNADTIIPADPEGGADG